MEWGPWIEHDGKGVPPTVIGVLILVEAQYHTGSFTQEEGVILPSSLLHPYLGCWDWKNFGRPIPNSRAAYARVTRYRIRRPLALSVLQNIAANPDAPLPCDTAAPEKELART